MRFFTSNTWIANVLLVISFKFFHPNSITNLNIPVEKHNMSVAPLLRSWVALAARIRPEEQQVVHSPRVAPRNRQQLLQPLPRRFKGCRRCHGGHGFGRSCKNETRSKVHGQRTWTLRRFGVFSVLGRDIPHRCYQLIQHYRTTSTTLAVCHIAACSNKLLFYLIFIYFILYLFILYIYGAVSRPRRGTVYQRHTATVPANVNAATEVITCLAFITPKITVRVKARGTPFILPVWETRLTVPWVGLQKSN